MKNASSPEKKPSRPRKDTYHHGNLRKELLKAASALLEKEGYNGFTLRKCAHLAGVSPNAPAHHFQNVAGLLTALATQGFEFLTEQMVQSTDSVAPKSSPERRVHEMFRSYIKFALDEPALYKVMFGPRLDGEDPAFLEKNFACYDLLKREMQLLHPDLVEKSLEVKTYRVLAQAHGLAMLLIDERFRMLVGPKRLFQNKGQLLEALMDVVPGN